MDAHGETAARRADDKWFQWAMSFNDHDGSLFPDWILTVSQYRRTRFRRTRKIWTGYASQLIGHLRSLPTPQFRPWAIVREYVSFSGSKVANEKFQTCDANQTPPIRRHYPDEDTMRNCVSISLNRSGSTFFMTTMNTFPNVVRDLEINLTPGTKTSLHRSLSDQSLQDIFDEIANGQTDVPVDSLVVSKIVVAPQHALDMQQAYSLLTSSLKSVDFALVILRPWFDQFLSKYLGGGHLSNSPAKLPPKIRKAYNTQAHFSERLQRKKAVLNLEILQNELQTRMALQERLFHPLADFANIRFASYAKLKDCMADLARLHVPSAGDAISITERIENSPTQKLPSPDIRDLFVNAADVLEIRKQWDDEYFQCVEGLASGIRAEGKYL